MAEKPMEVVLPDGSARLVEPSCSGSPREGSLEPTSRDFKFFVQPGNPNRILFFLDGGGACWDATTCVTLPFVGQSIHQEAINETAEALDSAGGVFDEDNPDNPYANYTKVFVPYCTGDIHWGSKDTTYTAVLPLVGETEWTIHHRGVDNLLATLHLLNTEVMKNRRKPLVDFASAKDITVTGSSAGGYGATLAYPYIAEFAPDARRLNLISDAAVGVLTEGFFQSVIYNTEMPGSSSWAIAENLPPWVPAFASPDSFLQAVANTAQPTPLPGTNVVTGFQPALFQALSNYRPDARLSSITTNADIVQVQFFGATLPPGALTNLQTIGLWYQVAAEMLSVTAELVPNYEYLLDNGTCHTFLSDGSCSLFDMGATGVSAADWITQMIKPGNRGWRTRDAGPFVPPAPAG
ncbi:MAG: pectin acetylesterase-family hydrolase [Halieaceae bacterium]|nr:pectin acetylesterase-family hydrolase [Halieaceae bacterium]